MPTLITPRYHKCNESQGIFTFSIHYLTEELVLLNQSDATPSEVTIMAYIWLLSAHWLEKFCA
jgi:hypothetical protein